MILDSLNPAQREAVRHTEGALLILAGAGSGKTKTLTMRLAYLINTIGIPPYHTLTLTFTNKASSQMRERALSLIPHASGVPLLCTFHRFGLLFLKFHIQELNRRNNFVLLDTIDTKNILKSIPSHFSTSYLKERISGFKNNLITPQIALDSTRDKNEREVATIYARYEALLKEQNLLDFDDLLLLPYEILDKNPLLCVQISHKYQYVMVDEYQDTNPLQFKLLQKICSTHQNLCVVGDDDQSIYGWRGADISNILNFQEHFANSKLIKLETNYRSTKQILQVANTLIAHNTHRIGKVLQSTKGEGREVELLHFNNAREEAEGIAKEIQKLKKEGIKPSEIAVLFRLNALSRSLEESFSRAKIPYKLLGTIRFYERAEVKDILSYLRYIANPQDDFSLSRIINLPRRGLGTSTQEKIFSLAQSQNQSVKESFKLGVYDQILSAKHKQAAAEFFDLIDYLQDFIATPRLLLDKLFEHTQLLPYYESSKEGVDRRANIEELSALVKDYFAKNPNDSLQDFLNNIPLHSDLDEESDENCVRALSIHIAKGLEFDCVFVMGLENGLFPLLHENSNLEEERRLAYVAFTRAKERLWLSYADYRFYRGKESQLEASMFLKESGLMAKKPATCHGFCAGDKVRHKIFGYGIITQVQKSDGQILLTINFGGLIKTIMANFVEKLED